MKGRHVFFTVGLICVAIIGTWNIELAKYLIDFLVVAGVGVLIFRLFETLMNY